jgi:cytochrome c oxidase subunit 3
MLLALATGKGREHMSTTVNVHRRSGERFIAPVDNLRGLFGLLILIATETCLFATMFCAYFLLGNDKYRWKLDQPPHLKYAFITLGVMLFASLVLRWGERMVALRRYTSARLAMGFAFLLGLLFLGLQSIGYIHHWKTLTPDKDAYGSIFYAITMLHDAHIIVGLLMMGFVIFLPRYHPAPITLYRPYRIAAIYWYWLTIVLFFIVLILYVIPYGNVNGF